MKPTFLENVWHKGIKAYFLCCYRLKTLFAKPYNLVEICHAMLST